MADLIGHGRCPLCGGQCRVSLSKNLLPVLTCNGCNIQLFARSMRSDELVRALIKTPAGALPVADAPTPPPVPAAPAVRVAGPVAAPPSAPTPTAATKERGFGLLKW